MGHVRLRGLAETTNHYAALLAKTGEPREAREQYQVALEIAQRIHSGDAAIALEGIASTYEVEGDIDRARDEYTEARAQYQAMGSTPDVERITQIIDALGEESRDVS